LKSVRNYIVLLSLIAGLLLFLAPIQNLPAWAQVQKVPHPAETIAVKGFLVSVDIPSGVPTVVEFDPKSGEVEMIDFQINSGHYLDTGLGGMDTEE